MKETIAVMGAPTNVYDFYNGLLGAGVVLVIVLLGVWLIVRYND